MSITSLKKAFFYFNKLCHLYKKLFSTSTVKHELFDIFGSIALSVGIRFKV